MGKFTGVLIASDFDNTLIYTENALKGLEPMPELLPENREAIEYFMAQGGTFSIATGRALPSFNGVRQGLPMNGPTIRLPEKRIPVHSLSAGHGAAPYHAGAGRVAGGGGGAVPR